MSSHGGSSDVDPKKILDAAVSKLLTNLPSSHGDGDALRRMLQEGSCESLLEELDALMGRIGKVKKGRFVRFVDKLRPGIDNLKRFSDAIGIYVQSDPTYSALIWGSLKLLVQLSSEYLYFFDTVTDSIVKIADALPDYKEYESIFPTQPKIRLALARIYVDILDYCGQLTNIFYKNTKTGPSKARSGAALFVHSIWEPVTDRLDTIMKRLHDHHSHLRELADLEANKGLIQITDGLERFKLVQNEMVTWERQYATETKALLDQIRRELGGLVSEENKKKRSLLLNEIRRWLNPPNVIDRLQEIRRNLEKYEGSGKWLLSASEYTGWRDANAMNNRGNLLWINGKPGAGKTHLVPVIYDDLDARRKQVIVFICDYQEETRNTRRGLLASILSQILRKDQTEGLLDIFSLMMAKSESATAVSLEELGDLLTVTLRHIPPSDYAIIIDGLDECEDSGEAAKDLSKLLSDMVSMKVVILGRTADEGLYEALSTQRTLELTPERVRPDIELYIERHRHKIMDFGWGEEVRELREPSRFVEYLADRADGMFMWVRIVLELLCTPIFHQRTEFLLTLGDSGVEGHLDPLYHRIIAFVCKASASTQAYVADTFNLIFFAQRKLRVEEFLILLMYPREGDNNSESFMDNLIRACGGLIQVTPDGYIQFIHGSVKDYFRRHEGKVGLKVPDERMDIRITDACLHYLLRNVRHEPLSGEPGKCADKNSTAERYPLLSYSSRYWAVHCTLISEQTRRRGGTPGPSSSKDFKRNLGHDGYSPSKILAHLNSFFPKKAAVLTWLEAWFLFDGSRNVDELHLMEVSETLHQLCERERGLSNNVYQRDILCARLRIIQQGIAEFSKQCRDLTTNPALLWIPDPSFLEPSVTQVQSMLLQPHPPDDAAISDTPFFSYSMKSNDGKKAAACFIWPSRLFVEKVSEMHPEDVKSRDEKDSLLREASRDWKVTVKIGNYDQENLTVTSGLIDIDHMVIHEYISLGLWKLPQTDDDQALDDYGSILSHPLVVFADDLHTLVVLREVYNIIEPKGKLTGRIPRLIMSCRSKLDYPMKALLADHHLADMSVNGGLLALYQEYRGSSSEIEIFRIPENQRHASQSLWKTSLQLTQEAANEFRSLSIHPVRSIITWICPEGGLRIANFIRKTEDILIPASSIASHISSWRNLKFKPCGNIIYIEDSGFELDLRTNPVFQGAFTEAPKHPKSQPNRNQSPHVSKNPFGPPNRSNSWNKTQIQSPVRVQEGLRSPNHQQMQVYSQSYQPFYQQMDPGFSNMAWNDWNMLPEFTFQSAHQHQQQQNHDYYQYKNYIHGHQNQYSQSMFFPQIPLQPTEEPPNYEVAMSTGRGSTKKRRNSQDHHHGGAWLSPPLGGMMSPGSSFGGSEAEMSVGEFSVNTSFEDDGGMVARGPEMKRSRSANSRRGLQV